MKKRTVFKTALGMALAAAALAAAVWLHFGGFGTGQSVDVEEILTYALPVEDLTVPKDARIIALGEATHGNAEFQQLKLAVFRQVAAGNGVRVFALEGDYGGCEQVNRYIHGGGGTAREAAAAIGFAIYRTGEMEALIEALRRYNEAAPAGEDLRFYGFDMQRIGNSMRLLADGCKALGVDTAALEGLAQGEAWSSAYTPEERLAVLAQVKQALKDRGGPARTVHLADVLMQHSRLQAMMSADGGAAQALTDARDEMMAENVRWILQQERLAGHEAIFVTGHNSHVAKWASLNSMGKRLSEDPSNGYYAIGTDFYRTRCNLPTRRPEKRTTQVFYSHDPIAKAVKLAGLDSCWLDFARVPEDSPLGRQAASYTFLGSLGESYSPLMRLLPPSYRMFQPPSVLYDSMIFVSEATPTTIGP